MGEIQSLFQQGDRGTGGAHALEQGMLVTIKENLLVRRVKASDQPVPWSLASTVRINFLDGFDGNAARFRPPS